MPRLSDEQILKARDIDLLTYLQTYEPGSIRKNRAGEYYMVEHDSLKLSNGKWFRHSTRQGGHSALDFLIKIRGVPFVDAVQSLTSGYVFTYYKAEPPPKRPAIKQSKSFALPKPNRNNDRAVAYLRGRGISKEVINKAVLAGVIYGNIKHRCIFVSKDENGVAKFACERGTVDDLKKDVAGSSKKYDFHLPLDEPNGHAGNIIAVFESPIDCLAHHTIHDIGQTGWNGFRLPLGGVSSQALIGFLERHPQINNIQLCLDNDKAGLDATNRIIKELLSDKRLSHIKITVAPPPIGKDYADTLQAINQNSISKSINRPKEAVF